MRTHGHSCGADGRGKPTPEYAAWCSMRARCLRSTNKDFKYYGGRGINICKRWNEFLNFLTDMGPCPAGYTLERKKNNKGYSKSNCKWATREEQSINRRTTRKICVGKQMILLKEAEKITGISRKTINDRINRGWTEQTATQPVKGQNPQCKRGHFYAAAGFYLTKHGHRVCRICAVDNATRYKARLKLGA